MTTDIEYDKITDPIDLANYRDILARFRKSRRSEEFQVDSAKAFLAYHGVTLSSDINDNLALIQSKILKEARLFLFQFHAQHRDVRAVFAGDSQASEVIYILCNHDKVKFGVATAATGLVSGFYHCPLCGKTSRSKHRHQCKEACNLCSRKRSSACDDGCLYPCSACNRVFRSLSCLEAHRKKNANGRGSKCTSLHACSNCNLLYRTDHEHDCDKPNYCKVCAQKTSREGHECNWPVVTEEQCEKMKREGDVFNYCGYDFECIQNKVNEEGEIENEGDHRVNLAVLRKVCDDCHLDSPKDHCDRCSPKVVVFKKEEGDSGIESIMDRFTEYITHDPTMQERTMIAHNSSAYDLHFILRSALRKKYRLEFINKGLRIVTAKTVGKGINNR